MGWLEVSGVVAVPRRESVEKQIGAVSFEFHGSLLQ